MKQIKFLIAIALVSVIAISCKDSKGKDLKDAITTEVEGAKETVKDAADATVEGVEDIKEGVETAVDSLKTDVKDAVETVKTAKDDATEEVKEVTKKVINVTKKKKSPVEGGC